LRLGLPVAGDEGGDGRRLPTETGAIGARIAIQTGLDTLVGGDFESIGPVMMVAPSGVSGINSQHDDQRYEQHCSHGNPTHGPLN
jgi:hypothetical protein